MQAGTASEAEAARAAGAGAAAAAARANAAASGAEPISGAYGDKKAGTPVDPNSTDKLKAWAKGVGQKPAPAPAPGAGAEAAKAAAKQAKASAASPTPLPEASRPGSPNNMPGSGGSVGSASSARSKRLAGNLSVTEKQELSKSLGISFKTLEDPVGLSNWMAKPKNMIKLRTHQGEARQIEDQLRALQENAGNSDHDPSGLVDSAPNNRPFPPPVSPK